MIWDYFLWISIHFRPRTRIANPLPQWALTGTTAHSNRGDAEKQTGPGGRLPTLSWELIMKKQGWLTQMWSTGKHIYIYLPNRTQTNPPVVTSARCCNIYPKCELVIQDFSRPNLSQNQKVSYGVPLYHFRAERQGGQEERRIKQRFSIITPEEEAASLCTPYPLKSKGPQSNCRLSSFFGPHFLPR